MSQKRTTKQLVESIRRMRRKGNDSTVVFKSIDGCQEHFLSPSELTYYKGVLFAGYWAYSEETDRFVCLCSNYGLGWDWQPDDYKPAEIPNALQSKFPHILETSLQLQRYRKKYGPTLTDELATVSFEYPGYELNQGIIDFPSFYPSVRVLLKKDLVSPTNIKAIEIELGKKCYNDFFFAHDGEHLRLCRGNSWSLPYFRSERVKLAIEMICAAVAAGESPGTLIEGFQTFEEIGITVSRVSKRRDTEMAILVEQLEARNTRVSDSVSAPEPINETIDEDQNDLPRFDPAKWRIDWSDFE